MTKEEKEITLKIRSLVKIEEKVNEISDIIDIANSKDLIRLEVPENLHPMVLVKLMKTKNIRWHKKSRNLFRISTVLSWN